MLLKICGVFCLLGSALTAHAAKYDPALEPKFLSRSFTDTQDFKDFFSTHSFSSPANWQNIRPRSYVISVDFTLSEKFGVRILEINGPSYEGGVSNFQLSTSLRPLRKLYYATNTVTGGSGHKGHDDLYGKLSFDELIAQSAQNFSQKTKLPVFIHRHNAILPSSLESWTLPLSRGLETFSWAQFAQENFLMNHPAINGVVTNKAALALLPLHPEVSIPTTFFQAREFFQSSEFLTDFLSSTPGNLFILKPIDSARSLGVKLVTRDSLMNPDAKLLRHIRDFAGWILQPYMPGDPVLDASNHYRNPVGRIFYHMIYDGSQFHILPLTAYQKINKFKAVDANAHNDPQKAEFSSIENSMEYSKAELSFITQQMNSYFAQVGRSLFEMSQLDLSDIPDSEASRNLRSLKLYEYEALKASVKRYVFAKHPDRHKLVQSFWSDNLKRKWFETGLDILENPLYRSVRNSKAIRLSCELYFKSF